MSTSKPTSATDNDALRPETEETTRVVIIGGGLAGIAAAIALQEDLGFEGFMIYEKAEGGVGGVWRDNTYPGCGSDIAGHWYSLSRELNPNWKAYYLSQPEIRAYTETVWARRGLRAHTRFGTEVVRATWDENAQVYDVLLEDVQSRVCRTVRARVVLNATGGFMSPRFPEELDGIETFRGERFHSARWRHDIPLAGKRVGVIGNGCSAAQFVPQISKDPSVQVTNFCRAPHWYVPRNQYDYPAWVKWAFAHIPFVMWTYRAFLMGIHDINFALWSSADSLVHRQARQEMTKYITMTAPERYHSKLIPQFPPGCKRIIVDPGYLESLHRPNVTLTYDGVERVVPEGVQLKTGEIAPLDVLIFGTGFSLLPPRLEIFGVGGLRLGDYWKSKGGPEAYYGFAVPNFPNYFMFLGPNSSGGHASVIFNEEVQIDHTIQLIKPILKGEVQSFAVREEASTKYNSWVQTRLARMVWSHCQSFYRRDSTTGKNFVTFPGHVALFWWLARRPRYSEYLIVGGERWRRVRRLKGILRVSLGLAVLMAVVGTLCAGKDLHPFLERVCSYWTYTVQYSLPSWCPGR